MKINAIKNYSYQKSENNLKKNSCQVSFNACFAQTPPKLFKKVWDIKKLGIMMRTEEQMEDLAEYLCREENLREVVSDDSRFRRLSEAVEAVKRKLKYCSPVERDRILDKAADEGEKERLFKSRKINW